MTKKDLIEKVKVKVAEKVGIELSKRETGEVIDVIMDTLIASVKGEGEALLPKIGKLKLVETAPRSGKIVTTSGETKEWTKPAGQKVKLVPSKALKEEIGK